MIFYVEHFHMRHQAEILLNVITILSIKNQWKKNILNEILA